MDASWPKREDGAKREGRGVQARRRSSSVSQESDDESALFAGDDDDDGDGDDDVDGTMTRRGAWEDMP